MIHRKSGRKLGVTTSHRKAMMANLCSSLIQHKRVETTLTRAKELRRVADRMITLGKRGTIHARRQAIRVLRNNRAVKVVFDELAPKFSDRMGGYTRILKLGYRRGDSAPMAVIEYIDVVPVEQAKTPKKEKKEKEKPQKATTTKAMAGKKAVKEKPEAPAKKKAKAKAAPAKKGTAKAKKKTASEKKPTKK